MGSAAATQAEKKDPPNGEELAEIRRCWPVGQLCVIQGLRTAAGARLNGRLAEVRSVDSKTGRLCLRLDPRHEAPRWKRVRPANVRAAEMEVGDPEQECAFCLDRGDEALVSPCHCRGSGGGVHLKCLQQAYEARGNGEYPSCPTCKHHYDGKLAVMLLEEVHEAFEHSLRPGQTVKLAGFTNNVELNGQTGQLVSLDEATGRWQVQFNDGSLKAVKTENVFLLNGETDEKRFNLLRNIAIAYSSAGQPSMAAPLLEKVVRAEEDKFGKWDAELATPLTNLGIAYIQLEDGRKAVGVLERALSIRTKAATGKESRDGEDPCAEAEEVGTGDVAATLANLGRAHQLDGNVDKALRVLKRALRIEETCFGKEHLSLVPTLCYLGGVLIEVGNATEATSFLERALRIQERCLGRDHVHLASTLHELGAGYVAAGEPQKAVDTLDRSVAIMERHLGETNLAVAPVLQKLGQAYLALGDEAKVGQISERVMKMVGCSLGAMGLPVSGAAPTQTSVV